MDPMLASFAAVAAGVPLKMPRVPLISNLSGRADPAAGSTAEYWRRHVREPVAFERQREPLAAHRPRDRERIAGRRKVVADHAVHCRQHRFPARP